MIPPENLGGKLLALLWLSPPRRCVPAAWCVVDVTGIHFQCMNSWLALGVTFGVGVVTLRGCKVNGVVFVLVSRVEAGWGIVVSSWQRECSALDKWVTCILKEGNVGVWCPPPNLGFPLGHYAIRHSGRAPDCRSPPHVMGFRWRRYFMKGGHRRSRA